MHPSGGAHRHGAGRQDQPLEPVRPEEYFYADLPQGYQISQLYHPLVGEGEIEVLVDEKDDSSAKSIGIERIHVEQDAGKLMHDQHPTMSYVDLNRSGVALMEIVSRRPTCVPQPKQELTSAS